MSKIADKAKQYTDKYKSILCPCKYCGNTDIRIWFDRSVMGKTKYSWTVDCMTPGCDYTMDTSIKKAIQKWNDRHSKHGG